MNSTKSSSRNNNNNNTTTNQLDSSNALSALDNFNRQVQSLQIPNENSSCSNNNNNNIISSNASCSEQQQQSTGLNTSRFQLNAKEVTIVITGLQFQPRQVYVHEGTRVHWIVKRSDSTDKVTQSSAVYAHSGPRFFVVSVPELDEESDPIHEVNDDQTGTTFSIVFSRVGSFEVICSNHTRMKSEIIVVESSVTLQALQEKEQSKQSQSKSAIMQQVDGFKYSNGSAMKTSTIISTEKKIQESNSWQSEIKSDQIKQNQFQEKQTEIAMEITKKIEVTSNTVSSYQAKLAKVNEEKRRILIRDEMNEGDDEKKVANDFIQELKEQIKAEKGKIIPVRKPAHYLPLYKDDEKRDDEDEEPAKLPESLAAALLCKKFLNGEGSKESSKIESIHPESVTLGNSADSKKPLNNLTVVVPVKKAIRKRSSSSSSGGSSQRRRRSRLVIDGYESDFYSNAASMSMRNAEQQFKDDQCETQSSRSAVRIPVLRKHAAAAAAAAAAARNTVSIKKVKHNNSNRSTIVSGSTPTVSVLPKESISLNVLDYKLAQRKLNGFNAKGGSTKNSFLTKKPSELLTQQSEQKSNFNEYEYEIDNDHDDEEKNTDTGDEQEGNDDDEDEDSNDYNDVNDDDDDDEEEDYEEVYEDYNDDEEEEEGVEVEGEDYYELPYDDNDEEDNDNCDDDDDDDDELEGQDENGGTLCREEGNDLEGSRSNRSNSSCSEDNDIYENDNDIGAQGCSESDQDERVDSIQMKHTFEVRGCKSDRNVEGFNEYDCNQVISEEDTMNSSAQTSKDNSVHSHSRGLRSRRSNINSIIHSNAVVAKKQDTLLNDNSELESKQTTMTTTISKQSLRKQLAKQTITQKAQSKKSSSNVAQFQKLVASKSQIGNNNIMTQNQTAYDQTMKKKGVNKTLSIHSGKLSSISQQKSGVAAAVVSALSSATSSPIKATYSSSSSTAAAAAAVPPSQNTRINSSAISSSSSMMATSTTITSTSISTTTAVAATSVRGVQSNSKSIGGSCTHATHTPSPAAAQYQPGQKGGKMKSSMGKSNSNNGSSSMKSPAQSILTTAESSKYSDTTKNFSQKGDFELETSDMQEKECGGVLLYRLRHSNKRRASTDQTIQESRCSHGHDDSDTRSIKSLKNQPISLGGTLSLAAVVAAQSVAITNTAADQQFELQMQGGQNEIDSKIATKSEIEDSEQDGSLKIYEYDRFVAGNHREGESTKLGLREFCRIQPRDSVAIALKGSVGQNSSSNSNSSQQNNNSLKLNELERNACAFFTSNMIGILEMRYETECWLDESLEDY